MTHQTQSAKVGSPRIVLIVDDDVVALHLMTRMIDHLECRPVACANPNDALTQIMGGSVCVVVSDISMPRMSGFALMGKIHEYRIDIPVVLVTARVDADYAAMSFEQGAFAFLQKPFNAESLRHLVDGALKQFASANGTS